MSSGSYHPRIVWRYSEDPDEMPALIATCLMLPLCAAALQPASSKTGAPRSYSLEAIRSQCIDFAAAGGPRRAGYQELCGLQVW